MSDKVCPVGNDWVPLVVVGWNTELLQEYVGQENWNKPSDDLSLSLSAPIWTSKEGKERPCQFLFPSHLDTDETGVIRKKREGTRRPFSHKRSSLLHERKGRKPAPFFPCITTPSQASSPLSRLPPLISSSELPYLLPFCTFFLLLFSHMRKERGERRKLPEKRWISHKKKTSTWKSGKVFRTDSHVLVPSIQFTILIKKNILSFFFQIWPDSMKV